MPMKQFKEAVEFGNYLFQIVYAEKPDMFKNFTY